MRTHVISSSERKARRFHRLLWFCLDILLHQPLLMVSRQEACNVLTELMNASCCRLINTDVSIQERLNQFPAYFFSSN